MDLKGGIRHTPAEGRMNPKMRSTVYGRLSMFSLRSCVRVVSLSALPRWPPCLKTSKGLISNPLCPPRIIHANSLIRVPVVLAEEPVAFHGSSTGYKGLY